MTLGAPSRLLFLACLLFLLQHVSGLYEDQVGMWDWHRQYVGRAKHVEFSSAGQKKRVIVATEQNALAALNLRTGQILWRHVLAPDDQIDQLVSTASAVLSLSNNGRQLRAWNLHDGTIQWESLVARFALADLHDAAGQQLLTLQADVDKDGVDDLVVLSRHSVEAISASTGKVIWKYAVNSSIVPRKVALLNNSIFLLAFHGVSDGAARGLTVVKLLLENGELLDEKTIASSRSLSPQTLVLSADNTAVALTSDHEHIFSLSLHNYQSKEQPLPPGKHKLLDTQLHGAVAVEGNHGLSIFDISGPELKLVQSASIQAISNSIMTTEGQSAYATAKSSRPGTLSFEVINPSGKVEQTTGAWEAHRGVAQTIWLNVYPKKDGGNGYRFLVLGEDDSLALLQQGETVWLREESLAGVIAAKVVDPPVARNESVVANVEAGIIEWVKEQVLAAKVTLMLANEEDKQALATARKFRPDKMKPSRDHNGFRRYVVVLTSSGKVAALHTGDGRIIWATLTSAIAPQKLMVWKVPHNKETSPQVLVIGQAKSGKPVLSWVDTYTGQEAATEELTFEVSQAFQLPYTDSQDQRLLMLTDPQDLVYVRPDTQEGRQIIKDNAKSIFYHRVDKAGGVIRGYSVRPLVGAGGAVGEGMEVWSVKFPRETEEIAAVAARRGDEAVHSSVRILGDRSVLYKYLNRNTLFVATTTPPEPGQAAEASTLVAYLLDTVTGRILYRVMHAETQGPVKAVMSENWVVYVYWNARAFRNELSVLEAFDDSKDPGGNILTALLGLQNKTTPFSSHANSGLRVLGQSYFFPCSVKTLEVTVSEKGITNKQVLAGTVSDQVMALDRRLVDPRRPANPSNRDREEGLIPYSEALPYMPQAFLTHGLQVEGMRGIHTAPARLESTSMVFAYGLDLFFTRTMPSKTYDLLTEDFSYALLVLTVVALVIAIGISYVLARRKDLKIRWK